MAQMDDQMELTTALELRYIYANLVSMKYIWHSYLGSVFIEKI